MTDEPQTPQSESQPPAQDAPESPQEPVSAAPAPVPDPSPEPAPPVVVDGRNRRTDNDALVGHFCEVVDGEHAGRVGSLERVVKHGLDGFPERVLVRTRDAKNELLSVLYKHCRPTSYTGGR